VLTVPRVSTASPQVRNAKGALAANQRVRWSARKHQDPLMYQPCLRRTQLVTNSAIKPLLWLQQACLHAKHFSKEGRSTHNERAMRWLPN
jgi:hypothetical protein